MPVSVLTYKRYTVEFLSVASLLLLLISSGLTYLFLSLSEKLSKQSNLKIKTHAIIADASVAEILYGLKRVSLTEIDGVITESVLSNSQRWLSILTTVSDIPITFIMNSFHVTYTGHVTEMQVKIEISFSFLNVSYVIDCWILLIYLALSSVTSATYCYIRQFLSCAVHILFTAS